MIIEVVLNTVLCVHQGCLRVETYIDEQLLLIDDFLHRTCQITATLRRYPQQPPPHRGRQTRHPG